MEEFSSFNPLALTEARRARGLNKSQLAERVGISRQAVSLLEQGSNKPTFENMAKISNALDMPSKFFLRERPSYPARTTATFFRKLEGTTKTGKDEADIKADWAYSFTSFLSRYIKVPKTNLPNFASKEFSEVEFDEIEDYAKELRKFWGLGFGPISNLTLLLEKNGIFVFQLDIPAHIDGLSFWRSDDTAVIICSRNVSAVRNRFNLAHELGHLLLHKGVQQDEHDHLIDLIESQAHRFAGAFLFPDERFCNEFYSLNKKHLISLKSDWKISFAAMIMRAFDLGIIADKGWAYRKIGGVKKIEPLDDVLEVERPALFRRGINALLEHNITDLPSIKAELDYGDADLADYFGTERNFFSQKDEIEIHHNVIQFKRTV
jgi:Zn-dependent peptidase ImmA (M78 family)/DNA-binding XRE family transcriptional regulator